MKVGLCRIVSYNGIFGSAPGSVSNISLLDFMHTTLEDLKARVRDDVKAEVDSLHAKIKWLEERVEV